MVGMAIDLLYEAEQSRAAGWRVVRIKQAELPPDIVFEMGGLR